MKRTYTYNDMLRTLTVGWGEHGRATAEYWRQYNAEYFGGRLKPLPIFFVPVSPYGHWRGLMCSHAAVTHIALAAPGAGRHLVADRGVLLHEMVHQFLCESGEYTSHDGRPWCREIMRLTKLLTGQDIWAGAYTVAKVKQADGSRKSVRLNRPRPGTGEPSLTQDEIAHWPHSVGIKLGPLSTRNFK
jgi:hypothetical protein